MNHRGAARQRSTPTPAQLTRAADVFGTLSPQRLHYRVATVLVEGALAETMPLSLAEAIAFVLQAWNAPYYRFRPFTQEHFDAIETLLERHGWNTAACRHRDIVGLTEGDREAVAETFAAFESVLGPVGAAKALHFLAPSFFPLWDRAIARKGYALRLLPPGQNSGAYWTYMVVVKGQVIDMRQAGAPEPCLKSLDEYNFCLYTRGHDELVMP